MQSAGENEEVQQAANWLSELGKQSFLPEVAVAKPCPARKGARDSREPCEVSSTSGGCTKENGEASPAIVQADAYKKGWEGYDEPLSSLGHPTLRANTVLREDQPTSSGRRGRVPKNEGPANSQGFSTRKDAREGTGARDRQGKGVSSLTRGESLVLSLGTAGPSRGPRTPRRASSSQGSGLHVVVRLGWKPLCEVHCNGLSGIFLGGHDRDLYIQATGKEYASLPLVDVSMGGCIMSCSQFEKAAGRELSKKWKESLHVVGEGEGSKATLASWLRRESLKFGDSVVGRKVWVCWCADSNFYLATITEYNRESGKHKVKYSDRVFEELHLPVELLKWGEERPETASGGSPRTATTGPLQSTPTRSHPSENEGAAHEPSGQPKGRSARASLHRANPLFHQSSGISVTSTSFYDAVDEANAAVGDVVTEADVRPPRRGGSLARQRGIHRLAKEDGAFAQLAEESEPNVARFFHDLTEDALPTQDAPKRARTGSTGERLQLSRQKSLPRVQEESLSRQKSLPPQQDAPSQALPGKSLSLVGKSLSFQDAWMQTADGGMAVTQPAAPGASEPDLSRQCSASPATLEKPPPAMFDEVDDDYKVRWMSSVLMQLEDGLAARLARSQSFEQPLPSLSSRFQAILAYAQQHKASKGYYEAMLHRYVHYKDQPALLREKLADFIEGAVYEDGWQRQRYLWSQHSLATSGPGPGGAPTRCQELASSQDAAPQRMASTGSALEAAAPPLVQGEAVGMGPGMGFAAGFDLGQPAPTYLQHPPPFMRRKWGQG